MRKINVAALSVFALLLAGCDEAPAPVSRTAVEKSIRETEAGMAKAFGSKDAAALTAFFTDDAVMMTPFQPPMKGHDGIMAGLKPLLADPNSNLEITADRIEVAQAGDMAVSRGTFTLTLTDPVTRLPLHNKGSYVNTFEKQKDGAWKAVFDVNCPESPAPAPPEPKKAARPAAKKKGKKR